MSMSCTTINVLSRLQIKAKIGFELLLIGLIIGEILHAIDLCSSTIGFIMHRIGLGLEVELFVTY